MIHANDVQAPAQKDIINKTTFIEFFEFHHGKRIVLFIDEFDLLLAHPDASVELLDALRFMKVSII